MKKLIASFSIAAMTSGFMGVIPAMAATSLSQVQPGDLVRGTSLTAVYYYGKDGFRYVFPNDKTYFTWYSNFNTVKTLSDADMGKIQLGGNVTYKPGVKMLKINSDPKTYAIDGAGTLRWVKTEAAAVALYGNMWNKMIDDVPDAFFGNYKQGGADIESASDYNKAGAMADATDIGDDKNLQFPKYVDITSAGFGASTINVTAGTAVRFTNKDSVNHTATADALDWGTGTLKPGESFSRYFKTAGTHTFFDSLMPENKSTIVVQ